MKVRVAGEAGPLIIRDDVASDLSKLEPGIMTVVPRPLLQGITTVGESSNLPDVLTAVMMERQRQDAKWGEQNHPNFAPHTVCSIMRDIPEDVEMPRHMRANYYGIPTEADAKEDCVVTFNRGKGNWGHILVEEIAESFNTESDAELEEELIQSAAVIVAWVQCIRRRREKR